MTLPDEDTLLSECAITLANEDTLLPGSAMTLTNEDALLIRKCKQHSQMKIPCYQKVQ